MSKEWFMKLDTLLEKKFKDLLHPSTDNNVSEISKHRMLDELIKEREKSKIKAYKLRKDLLNISKNIKEWKTRYEKAKACNANELADKASNQIKKLMQQGENLWEALDQTGIQFRKIEANIKNFSKQSNIYEDEWIQLETELELDRLREKISLNQ